MHKNPSDSELKTLLTNAKTIAVVGASNNEERPVYGIMRRLQKVGYHVIPVNPREKEISRKSLRVAVGHPRLCRHRRRLPQRADTTPPIAEEAVAIKAGALWLQQWDLERRKPPRSPGPADSPSSWTSASPSSTRCCRFRRRSSRLRVLSLTRSLFGVSRDRGLAR